MQVTPTQKGYRMLRTRQQVIATAEELVAANPHKTNEGECVYRRVDDKPHCIIANILDRDGLLPDLDTLRDSPVSYGGGLNCAGIGSVDWTERLENDYDTPALDFLNSLQIKADNNGHGDITWADALQTAKEEI
jgi:hypothetical protein